MNWKLSPSKKAAHYRAQHDAASLFAALHEDVKSGDSKDRAQKLLGEGEPPRNRARLIASCKKFAERLPHNYPAGVQDDDDFQGWSYAGGNITVQLQFRDGRLINFDPKEFEKVPEVFVGRLD